MKVATFNANSIRARLEIILNWLAHEKPDILFVQETKVQDKDFPSESFKSMGYQFIFKGQKSYNGVATLSKVPLDKVRMDLYKGNDEQARFLSAEISGIPMINIYVPQGFAPGTDKFGYKLQWLKDLISHISNNYDSHQPLLIAGDFNIALEPIDVYDPEGLQGEVGFHPDEQVVFQELFDWGLVDLFRKHHQEGGYYTFWDYRIPNAFKRKMGWRIDYILASPPLAEKCSSTWIDTKPRSLQKPSDHTFLVSEFNIDF